MRETEKALFKTEENCPNCYFEQREKSFVYWNYWVYRFFPSVEMTKI